MDFSSKTKAQLLEIIDLLELDVEAVGNKPTKDEMIVALEAAEKADPEAFKEAVSLLELEDEPEATDNDDDDEPNETEVNGEVYTYVGGGEDSPRKINFMSQLEFVKGRPVVVTNKALIKKIKNNPTFRPGKVSEDEIQVLEDEATEHAEAMRKADRVMSARFRKKHSGKDKED